MNNIQFIKRSNQENLVIFIHGFQGGIETWRYNEKSFSRNYYYRMIT